MRIGGIPNFKKLWGRIDSNLDTGVYELRVITNFNLEEWSGNKYFILSTKSSFGGKNYLLPILFLITGCLCVLATILLLRTSRRYVESVF